MSKITIIENPTKMWSPDLSMQIGRILEHEHSRSFCKKEILKLIDERLTQENRRILNILRDPTNFTWIDIEGKQLLKEIIFKING